jgi:Spy/CpxP family protein refolding chaperone
MTIGRRSRARPRRSSSNSTRRELARLLHGGGPGRRAARGLHSDIRDQSANRTRTKPPRLR